MNKFYHQFNFNRNTSFDVKEFKKIKLKMFIKLLFKSWTIPAISKLTTKKDRDQDMITAAESQNVNKTLSNS